MEGFGYIDQIAVDHGMLQQLLISGNPSLYANTSDYIRKILILSTASAYERFITELLCEFAQSASGGNLKICSLVKTKAISRQYHTFFDWDKQNANKFFSMFGDEFRAECAKRIAEDPELNTAIRNFLMIGRERNRLVHEDLANATIELTTGDLLVAHESAKLFLRSICKWLEVPTENI